MKKLTEKTCLILYYRLGKAYDVLDKLRSKKL